MELDRIPFNALIVGPTNTGQIEFILACLEDLLAKGLSKSFYICPQQSLQRFVDRENHINVTLQNTTWSNGG